MDPFESRVARRLRLEAQEQASDTELATAAQHAASLNLSEALADQGERGNLVRLDVDGRPFVGRIVHVGLDLCTIRTSEAHFDLALPLVRSVSAVDGERAPRVVSTGHPGSMAARLRELAVAEVSVCLGLLGGTERHGAVFAVATDHVALVRPEGLVPLTAIAWIRVEGI